MNNHIRVIKLKQLNCKLNILLLKIEPLRNEAIEIYLDLIYYKENYYNNPFRYKIRIAEVTKEHSKIQGKINKLLLQYNKVNSERKLYKIGTKVKQINILF